MSKEEETKESLEIFAKWNGKEYKVCLKPEQTICDVKESLFHATQVLPKRQKLIGLFNAGHEEVKGRSQAEVDMIPISRLSIPNKKKFMLVGTPEESIFQELKPEEMPDVFNDFDYDPRAVGYTRTEENMSKLHNRLKTTEIHLINEPRPDKKLLVLDLDYTLLDMKALDKATSTRDIMRPHLEEFLIAAFKKYDIAFWSQTHWKWIEMKLSEMGCFNNPHYHVLFALDRKSMFPITTHAKEGKDHTHEVKALEIIWNKLPQYSAKNTIHVDDLRRNFAMNPQSGLKVHAFKDALQNREDKELFHLSQYLDFIGDHEDFTTLDHSQWKYTIGLKKPK
ncbi:hypothetical protein PROFUN_01779 [Planoprotostelium fungivorum]|uniref:FCP1 homology domain-containing protein n=1 Tax=Planoprotostelium fungivorum TaxID=1890364 RepID=A0A2P6MWK2_9EUKA|nr:hypothetical protein PROFUN_01779 [Planoprotostelium fungivorum]